MGPIVRLTTILRHSAALREDKNPQEVQKSETGTTFVLALPGLGKANYSMRIVFESGILRFVLTSVPKLYRGVL